MLYANEEVRKKVGEKLWKKKKPYYEAPESDGKRRLATSPEGNYVPEIKSGLGISEKSFPNVRGVELFYEDKQ